MTLTRKDLTATVLTLLSVLVYATTHEGWGVPLIGDSRRWAAGAIVLLGILTCAQGRPAKDRLTTLLAALGVAAFALAVFAFVTASLTPLSLLVADIVLLWLVSTVRHSVGHPPARPVAT